VGSVRSLPVPIELTQNRGDGPIRRADRGLALTNQQPTPKTTTATSVVDAVPRPVLPRTRIGLRRRGNILQCSRILQCSCILQRWLQCWLHCRSTTTTNAANEHVTDRIDRTGQLGRISGIGAADAPAPQEAAATRRRVVQHADADGGICAQDETVRCRMSCV
jgi:hypothetical protein